MSPTIIHLSPALTRHTPKKFFRCMSYIEHMTQAQLRLLDEHLTRKARLPRRPSRQKPSAPRFLHPHIHHPESSRWIAHEKSSQGRLERNHVLKVISWNIFWSGPDPAARASAALEHLKTRFGVAPPHLVLMLQEVCIESLEAILEDFWVQKNFILSDVRPPESIYTGVASESFVFRRLEWDATSYFTLMMLSKDLTVVDCFRVPFDTCMGRDALVVDIPILTLEERDQAVESIRLCTTHLESLWGFKRLRLSQLASISTLLKGTPITKSRPIAGIVGGDMNAVDPSEHEFHKAEDVDLKDAWEDVPARSIPVLKPFQKDLSYSRARGNTWGYQNERARTRKRLDKSLCTGSMETVALSEPRDVTGKLGRLGIYVKTDVSMGDRNKGKVNSTRENCG